MRTPSTRALSALAFDRNQEFDPGPPLSPGVLEDLELVVGARAIVTDISPADRQRRRDRARRRRLAAIPEWFSVDDLIAAPWETVHHEPV
jgi:hypothetical protein